MTQCAWYDITRAIDDYDSRWHARRYEVEEVAKYLRGEGMESKAFVAKVAQAIVAVACRPCHRCAGQDHPHVRLRQVDPRRVSPPS